MKLDTDLWRKLPAAGAVLLTVGIGLLGVLYWNNVRTREEYLRGRNFRLLAVLASQTENIIETRARILRLYDQWPLAHCPGEPAPPWTRDPQGWVKTALSERKSAVKECGKPGPPLSAPTISGADGRIVLTWSSGIQASLVSKEILGETFLQKRKQRAFDTVAIATPNGTVLYADGARSTELEVMPLGTLLPATATANGDPREITNVIAEYPVSIAGVRYRMFVQPCCRGLGTVSNLAGAGLAIVGLVEDSALRSAALAVSPLLVLSGVVAVLAALVSAVFLKVAFSSLRQRMSALDALQLAASSVFGVAMATILLITVGAYVSIRADVDDQLEELSKALDTGLDAEITAAYQQDKQVMEQLLASDCRPVEGKADRPECWTNAEIRNQAATAANFYPGPTAVAIVDTKGDQRIKAAPDDRSIQVNVADRSYFVGVKDRDGDRAPHVWRLSQCGWRSGSDNLPPAGCFVESIWSWITARPQVLLAIPTPVTELPVASIAIPMRSAINPILPAGLEFAVVNADGLVLLHSDSARNVNENFLAEADQNPRLRALMAARSAGHVSIDYWGRPYRAHVRPSAIDGWSIVTMFDEQHARALALEWAAASLVLLTFYMAACVVVLLIVFKTSAAWLWPDPKRQAAYPLLALFYAAGIVAFGVFSWRAESTARLYAGVALPGMALAVTFLVLAVRPKLDALAPDWSAVNRDYVVMAALGLVLAAVVPGVAIVAFSHDLHMQSFIKHRQIGLARAMASRPIWRRDLREASHPLDAVDDYAHVFFDTRRETLATTDDPSGHHHRSIAHLALEDYMPYLSPFSVEMRELSHEDADDDSWQSRQDGNRLIVTVGRPGLGEQVGLSSVLPVLTPSRAIGAARPFAAIGVLLAFCGLVFAIWRIVNFMLRRVFLSDVIEPIPAIRELLGTVGQDMFVVCKDPAAVTDQIKGGETLLITPLARSGNLDAAWRQVQDAGDKAGPARAVVIPDLDSRRNEIEVMRRKLRLIEGLMDRSTVVLLSRVSPQAIAASATVWRGTKTDKQAELLLARFQLFNWRDDNSDGQAGCVATWWSGLVAAWTQGLEWLRQPSTWCQATLEREQRDSTEAIKRICQDLLQAKAVTSGDLTCTQVLDEVEERARPIYLRIWRGCSEDERIVLAHVAVNGLANCGSRHVVRGLLMRGLLRKDPELRLMNRSFTNFVLATERRLEVSRLEVASEPGLWNHLRVPLGVGATAVVLFLMTTQREMFDSTVTVAAGVTTALPTLLRLTSIFASLGLARPAADEKTA